MYTHSTPYGTLIESVMSRVGSCGLGTVSKGDGWIIHFKMNRRMRTCAGRCLSSDVNAIVELNAELFSRISDMERKCIIAHEAAHALCRFSGGESGHGWQWKAIAKALGDDGMRCNDHEVQTNLVRRMIYNDLDRAGQYYVMTSNRLKKVHPRILIGLEFIGEISIDKSKKEYRWVRLTNNGWLDKDIFKAASGFKRVP